MILVLVLAAVLWGVGALTGAPTRARLTMIGLLLVGVLAAHVILPAGHPLREALGGEAAVWLILIAAGGLVLVYRAGLVRLRDLARRREAAARAASKRDRIDQTELGRYLRHIVLREIGGPGQAALKEAKVLVVGAGGLGSPVLEYLAGAGVGTIGVIDDDRVEATNLQRQVIHADARVGMPKVFSAEIRIREINPFVTVRPYLRRLAEDVAAELVAEFDLVLDGSDNFATRYLVNRTCVAAGRPLIAAALTQWEGQIALWDPARGGPCFQCVFPEAPDPDLVPSCAEAGVLGPLPGIIGSMMAAEAVKLIAGAGEPLRGRLMIFDALYADARVIRTRPRPDCAVCGGRGAAT